MIAEQDSEWDLFKIAVKIQYIIVPTFLKEHHIWLQNSELSLTLFCLRKICISCVKPLEIWCHDYETGLLGCSHLPSLLIFTFAQSHHCGYDKIHCIIQFKMKKVPEGMARSVKYLL